MFEDLIHAVRRLNEGYWDRDSEGREPRYVTFRDPNRRFVMRVPQGWSLQMDRGVHASSPRPGCFARVDFVKDAFLFWDDLHQELGRLGGSIRVEGGLDPLRRAVRASVELGRYQFAWEMRAFDAKDGVLVLTTARMLRPAAEPRAGTRMLAGIRRSFRAIG